jgi:hypothetical protein
VLKFFYIYLIFQIGFPVRAQAMAAKNSTGKTQNCQAQLSPEQEAKLKELGQKVLRDLGVPDVEESTNEDTQAYENIVSKLPDAVGFEELIPAIAVIDYDEDAIPFIEKMCKKMKSTNQRLHYLAWMAKRRIIGARVAKFDSVIGGDVEFGLELLKDDDPLLKDVF